MTDETLRAALARKTEALIHKLAAWEASPHALGGLKEGILLMREQVRVSTDVLHTNDLLGMIKMKEDLDGLHPEI